jgi:type VI secretion system protein ImpB
MPKEASKAPTTRLNITYQPDTGNAQEQVELPLRLLFVGDYRVSKDERKLSEREALSVNKENLNETLAKVFSSGSGANRKEVPLVFEVDDTMSGEPDTMSGEPAAKLAVSLNFRKMSDFGPDAVAEQVPELKKLLELRATLAAMRAPLTNVPELRKRFGEILNSPSLLAYLLSELGIEQPQGGK